MPASTRVHKVQKQIHKKKGSKISALHANSRDSQRLQRASARDDKLSRQTVLKNKLNQPYIHRISYILSALPAEATILSIPQTQDVLATYLCRHDAELESEKTSRRPGRPASSREAQLKKIRDSEEKEYNSGFWIPDLGDADNVAKFRNWGGTWGGLSVLKFVRITTDGKRLDSSFPPGGKS
ncbi:hypothetical protein K402DRAFT_415745 [Aulographum hederae CBS 113979]|uniref:Translation machinery-associated protein 16 n=1 Tax=Aulographum hederae CBS 113979 TaxID=1176131 RepID=A0A6G1GJA8_9PEZI|nr:hypothetical protein K402DRAFT_415745 [Aulographum hederae CBS 113979]